MPDIDEDVMRELMIHSTADLFAGPTPTAAALRRHRQRQLRTRVLGVTGIAAAAGLAVGTLVIPSGAHPGVADGSAGAAGTIHTAQLTSAQKTLYSLSAAAAATRRPADRYVVLTEKSVDTEPGSSGGGGETGPKTSVIDTVTGGGVTYQDITVSGSNGDPQPPAVLNAAPGTSPTTAQLDAMPISTAKLRAFLLAQAKQQLAQAYAEEQRMAKLNSHGKVKIGAFPAPGNTPTDNDLVFEQAADLLWEPNLSPALRAALYKVLAATPGVTVKTQATDSAGRPAVEISRVDNVGKTDVETFENPRTGATLESAWQEPTGEFLEDLYLSISYTNHVPANPYQG
ncbi:MAG: hypothetical protein ACRDNO_30245 [Trebonia sp.]